jgi:hypothetical protein
MRVDVHHRRDRRRSRQILERLVRIGAEIPTDVDLMRLQLRRERVLVGDDFVDDLGDLGLAQEIVGVGRHAHFGAARP